MNENKIKPSFQTERQELAKILPIDTPFTVIADISDVCNFKCNYCFRGNVSDVKTEYYRKNKLMSFDMFKKVVDQCKSFPKRIKRFSLSHEGESLVHPNFVEMVNYAKEMDFADCIEIHTNASLLTEEYAKKISKSGLDRIIISIQGLTGEKYKNICDVNLDFEKFYNNLKTLYENKTKLHMSIKIVDIALDDGEDKLFYEKFSKISDDIFIETIIPLWDGIKYENVTKKDLSFTTKNKYGNDYKEQLCCPLIFYTINVLPDGTIFPCTNLEPPFILGNINEITLLQAWNSNKRKKFLIEQLKNTRKNHEVCKKCYIPQNTVLSSRDIIDDGRDKILVKLLEN